MFDAIYQRMKFNESYCTIREFPLKRGNIPADSGFQTSRFPPAAKAASYYRYKAKCYMFEENCMIIDNDQVHRLMSKARNEQGFETGERLQRYET